MIGKCDCKNEYQDRVYGKGKRVINEMLRIDGGRCTVCGKEHRNPTKPTTPAKVIK